MELLGFEEKNTLPSDANYLQRSEFFVKLAQISTEGSHAFKELEDLLKEPTVGNTDLYTAKTRLNDDEFDQAYASFQRDSNRQTRNEPGQNHKDHSDCSKTERRGGSQSSNDQFQVLSARLDEIIETLGQSLISQDKANASKMTDGATEKPHRSVWKRFWKY